MLSLISQLSVISTRPQVAREIAAEMGVEDLLILVRDDELDILLPAPGFQQTIAKAGKWRDLLDTYSDNETHTQVAEHPITGLPTTVTTLVHERKLAVILAGGHPAEDKLSLLQDTLPLLAAVFLYEQYVEQAKVNMQQSVASAVEHRNIARKLDETRKNLQLALHEKDNEIHERIKSEIALAQSEQLFRFMAESLPAMIFTADASGTLTYISPQWEQYTGLSVKVLRKSRMSTILHPNDAEDVTRHWLHSYETGADIEQEVRIRRADGKYRWHLSRSKCVRDETGQITMWVGSSTDIEEVKTNMQKKLELEEKTVTLTRQQDTLLELNAAKDEFIRLASHQLRTPATGVKMYIGMLMGGFADEPTENQMRMLDQAYQSNERQLHIIEDLLKVATIDAGKVVLVKEKTDIKKLLNEVSSEMQHAISGRKQKIIIDSPLNTVMVEIDKRYIRMVIENIIDNASKYSPDNTLITVKLEQNNHTDITIIDQGVGIAEKDQSMLFKKFSRIHNVMSVSASGTGIGLYWAKEIVSLHGGTITLKSELGHGSSFTIRLPKLFTPVA